MKKTPRNYCLNLLARREYSRCELEIRMHRQFPDLSHEEIVPVLEQLESEGLQSDVRMAESYCRYRAGRLRGPLLIAQELKSRGLSSDVVRDTLQAAEVDWYETAVKAAEKKNYPVSLSDQQKIIKLQRFLSSRGFDFNHIEHAVSQLHCD